ncbi:MAG TPA: TolC family protein [Longimicrobium sp.]|nr:TolC family protein [Longimicrobium sp.]
MLLSRRSTPENRARICFREGVADFLTVLDAERSLLDAQNQLTAARVDAALSLVDVYQATGQGVAAGEDGERVAP